MCTLSLASILIELNVSIACGAIAIDNLDTPDSSYVVPHNGDPGAIVADVNVIQRIGWRWKNTTHGCYWGPIVPRSHSPAMVRRVTEMATEIGVGPITDMRVALRIQGDGG